jgi:hypothetical protein
MKGYDRTGMWQIFDRYSDREMSHYDYWRVGVKEGIIRPDELLPEMIPHAIGIMKHEYNADRRRYNEPRRQILEVPKQLSAAGKDVPTHKAWDMMSPTQHAGAYKREHDNLGKQKNKVAWMYDSAVDDFGPVHAAEFIQLTLGYPRPDAPGDWNGDIDPDDDHGLPF